VPAVAYWNAVAAPGTLVMSTMLSPSGSMVRTEPEPLAVNNRESPFLIVTVSLLELLPAKSVTVQVMSCETVLLFVPSLAVTATWVVVVAERSMPMAALELLVIHWTGFSIIALKLVPLLTEQVMLVQSVPLVPSTQAGLTMEES